MGSVRRYRIKSHDNEFLSGVMSDGTQILLVPTSATRVAYIQFESAGNMISSEEFEGAINVTVDTIIVTHGRSRFEARKTTIAVATFCVAAVGLGIRPRPDSFEEFLRDPVATEPDIRYRERTAKQVREWDENNRFVLDTWGKEYWMDGDGSVFAT